MEDEQRCQIALSMYVCEVMKQLPYSIKCRVTYTHIYPKTILFSTTLLHNAFISFILLPSKINFPFLVVGKLDQMSLVQSCQEEEYLREICKHHSYKVEKI